MLMLPPYFSESWGEVGVTAPTGVEAAGLVAAGDVVVLAVVAGELTAGLVGDAEVTGAAGVGEVPEVYTGQIKTNTNKNTTGMKTFFILRSPFYFCHYPV